MMTDTNEPSGASPGSGSKRPRNLEVAMERIRKARDFPHNTCAASRHAELVAEGMMLGVWQPDCAHQAGESILATVAALYEARTKLRDQASDIERLESEIASEREYSASIMEGGAQHGQQR